MSFLRRIIATAAFAFLAAHSRGVAASEDPGHHFSAIPKHGLVADHDNDGLLDKFDADMDGDGAWNDWDARPLDPNKGAEDSDGDGLTDFVDFSSRCQGPQEDCAEKIEIQLDTYLKIGIAFVEDDAPWSPELMRATLKSVELITPYANLPTDKLKSFVMTTRLRFPIQASYDVAWKTLRIKPGPEASFGWRWIITHELFHFVQAANPSLFNLFIDSVSLASNQPLSPSLTQIASQDPEEHFAEAGTASVLATPKDTHDIPEDFFGSSVYTLFQTYGRSEN